MRVSQRARELKRAAAFKPKRKLKVKLISPENKEALGFAIFPKTGPKVKLGFITRGHRESYIKRAGVFSQALRQFEALERKTISEVGFVEYRKAIIGMIREDHKHTGPIGVIPNIKFLLELKKPHFIDYAKIYESVIVLLKKGYSLTPPSLAYLREKNPKLRASRSEVIKYLETNRRRLERVKYENRALLVLTKPL